MEFDLVNKFINGMAHFHATVRLDNVHKNAKYYCVSSRFHNNRA